MAKRRTDSTITVRHADGRVETARPSKFQKPSSYAAYRRSRHWRSTRKKALLRDGHACTVCGRTRPDAVIEVHHLTYERIWHERLEDLVTLCQRCHATEHQWASRRS